MKNKLVLVIIVCVSCSQQADDVKLKTRFSESDLIMAPDSTAAKLDKLSYVEHYNLIDWIIRSPLGQSFH